MRNSVLRAGGYIGRPVRIASSALAVGALVATTMTVTATSADAAKNRTWNRLAQCESGGRWHINSTYDGGLQFSPSTWKAYGGGKFAPYAHKAKRWQQIAIAERTLRGQGWGAWPSCSAKLGLHRGHAKAKWEGPPKQRIQKMHLKKRKSAGKNLHRMSFKQQRTAGMKQKPLRSMNR